MRHFILANGDLAAEMVVETDGKKIYCTANISRGGELTEGRARAAVMRYLEIQKQIEGSK